MMSDVGDRVGALERRNEGCSERNIAAMLPVLATIWRSESKLFGALEWSKIRRSNHSRVPLISLLF
jgi:hypothetical protein